MQDTSLPAPVKAGPQAFLFVIVAVAIDMLAFGIIIPVLPQLIRELKGIPAEEATLWIGALGATYAVMNFLFGALLGALSDRFGRRPVLLASIATLALDFLIMGFAGSIWLLFLGRALSGISGATYSTANAYIADVTEPAQRGKAFGMIGAAFGFGFVFGPVLGGFLGEFDPRAPFFAAAGLAALNFLYGIFVLPESLPAADRRGFNPARANPFGAFRHFAKLPQVSWFLMASGLFALGHTVFPSTWSVHGEIRYDWTPQQIGLSLGAVGVGAALVQAVLIGPILKRFGTVNTALMGYACMCLALTGYALAGAPWLAYMMIPLGALSGVIGPSVNTLMANVTPRNAQGELQAAQSSLMSLSMIFGPLLMSGILHQFTHKGAAVHFGGAAFVLAAVLTALAVVPFLRGVAANAATLANADPAQGKTAPH
jgi:MFS transporter, DHA1 family, tetracycline resistance protein